MAEYTSGQRPERSPKDLADLEATIGPMIDKARQHVDSNVRPSRLDATAYYKGELPGQPDEGYSKVVLTVLRNAVRRTMASFMRIFAGSARLAWFEGRSDDDRDLGPQVTDYINFILMEDNPGYKIVHGMVKDGLVRRTGWVKWWAEKIAVPETAEYTGLDERALLAIVLDKNAKITKVQQTAEGYSCTVEQAGDLTRIKIRNLPGEEAFWNEGARDEDDAEILGHTREVPRYELKAMGYTDKELNEALGVDGSAAPVSEAHGMRAGGEATEAASRRPDGVTPQDDDTGDPATARIRYTESYVYLQYGEDERVRLYKVCTIGDAHKVLRKPVPVSHRPMAYWTPDPEPHTLEGYSFYDDLKSMQDIDTVVLRGTLDSLALAIDPPTIVDENRVNIKDLMAPIRQRIVRTTGPVADSVATAKHAFVGPDALPVLEYMQRAEEGATGQTSASTGLDADVMQSTTKQAVTGALTAAQASAELLCRTFMETGFKRMLKGILKTVIENQNGPRIVRLRGKAVPIDPRSWDANMDVRVNAALGTGLMEDKVAILQGIAADQAQFAQLLGPGNPMVGLVEMRNTRARIIELLGFPNPAEFYREIDPEQEKAAVAAAAEAANKPSSDPNAALAQAEIEKAKITAATKEKEIAVQAAAKERELDLREREMQARLELETEKTAAEITLKRVELELKYQTKVDGEQLKSQTALARQQIAAEAQLLSAEIGADATREKAAVDVLKEDIKADNAGEQRRHEEKMANEDRMHEEKMTKAPKEGDND